MNLDKCSSIVSHILFVIAFILLVTAVVERIINLAGYTILASTGYTGGRLLEFAAISLVFVLALLLRQVLDELRKSKTP